MPISDNSHRIKLDRWRVINERLQAIKRRNIMHSEEIWRVLGWAVELANATKPEVKPNRILCVDQSYSRAGFAVVSRDKIHRAESMDLTKLNNPTSKRNAVRELTRGLIDKWNPRLLLVERVRIFAGSYITEGTALPLAAMTSVIVDVGWNYYRLPTYAVNTQSWKKVILGDGRAKKAEAVAFILETFDMKINHDAADAACMGLAVYNGCKVKRQQ